MRHIQIQILQLQIIRTIKKVQISTSSYICY